MSNGAERGRAEEQESTWSGLWKAAAAIGAVAGTALLAWGALSSDPEPGAEENTKEMKQPGREGKYMNREEFEKNPSGYFRALREEEKNNRN